MSARKPLAGSKNELASKGYVDERTDLKVAIVINSFVLPLRARVAALEKPWYRRLFAKPEPYVIPTAEEIVAAVRAEDA